MKKILRIVSVTAVALAVVALNGCGKNSAEKKQEAAMKQLAEYKGEASDGQPVSEDEAKAELEQSRKDYEAQTKAGASAGHMSMDEFKKMAESKKK